MNQLSLRWKDFISPTLSISEYLEKYKDKTNIIKNYEDYMPEQKIINEIASLLKSTHEKLKIVALGAEWCPDCSKNVPAMIKIIESLMKVADAELRILYGIMVNALHGKGEILWHKGRSPPEAVDPKFELKAIPTFYIFDFEGELLGTIVEGPKIYPTLEEELLTLLKKK